MLKVRKKYYAILFMEYLDLVKVWGQKILQARTIANNCFSIVDFRVCVSLKALDAKTIGLSFGMVP